MDINNLKKTVIDGTPRKFQRDVEKAIQFAEREYCNVKRYNGLPMLTHALNVAILIQEYQLDVNSVIAGILHEIPLTKRKEIEQYSSKQVMQIVEQTQAIRRATNSTDTDPQLIIRYILNDSKDLRAVFIKIFDKLDDVRSISTIPDTFLKETLNKSLNIYSILAEYLFLDATKKEMESKSFQYYLPQEFNSITKKMEELGINKDLLNRYQGEISKHLNKLLSNIQIHGRIKGRYSIYNKLKKYEKEWISPNINSLYDLIAFRIVTNSKDNCFKILEILMDNGEIVEKEFDDYISYPKPNGYMAIQFPIKFKNISDLSIEVQILTEDMYYQNKFGASSHIAYKASKTRFAKPTNRYDWVECVQKQIEENRKRIKMERDLPIKCNVFEEEVFAFTPKNKIIQLNRGDTVIDFAFKLHTNIGNSAVSAKVNGVPAKLGQVLKTGDVVEIKTDKKKTHQSEGVMEYANSNSTKNKILKYLSKSITIR